MDPYNDNIRMANEGIEMTLRTLKTVISSEPRKEDLEGYVDSLRNDMENFIQETVRLQQNRSLLQEFKRTHQDNWQVGGNQCLVKKNT